MAAKFKKIDPRMWHDEKFVALDQLEKLIAIYAITAQSNRIGLFKFSAALAAEELCIPAETFPERFGNVCRTLNWGWDKALRVVFLPTWWRYNPPENPNVLKACLDDIDDLPQTPLLDMFCGNLAYLSETLHQTFRERLGKRMAHHEHEHEHKHEHKPTGQKTPKSDTPEDQDTDLSPEWMAREFIFRYKGPIRLPRIEEVTKFFAGLIKATGNPQGIMDAIKDEGRDQTQTMLDFGNWFKASQKQNRSAAGQIGETVLANLNGEQKS
jgi:hypothetical protein